LAGELDTPKAVETIHNEQLSLAMMRTCRAMYVEAFESLWSHNTFLFAKGRSFAQFVSERSQKQKAAIRHIAIKSEHALKLRGSRDSVVISDPYPSTTGYVDNIGKLMALDTAFITSAFEADEGVLEKLWCDGKLEISKNGFEVIDQLRRIPTLRVVNLHIRDLWHSIPPQKTVTLVRNGQIKTELSQLLEKAAIGQKHRKGSRILKLDLTEDELIHRREQWDNYLDSRDNGWRAHRP
jgi:hypothetical protein